MKKFTPDNYPGPYLLLLTVLAIAMIHYLTGCEVIKKSSSRKEAKIEASGKDSGRVTRNESQEKKDSSYGRQTIIFQPFPPPARDCVINKNYYTYPPAQIITEWGSKSEEKNTAAMDSGWQKMLDLRLAAIEEKSSSKETTWFSPGVILAIFAGFALFLAILVIVLVKILKPKLS